MPGFLSNSHYIIFTFEGIHLNRLLLNRIESHIKGAEVRKGIIEKLLSTQRNICKYNIEMKLSKDTTNTRSHKQQTFLTQTIPLFLFQPLALLDVIIESIVISAGFVMPPSSPWNFPNLKRNDFHIGDLLRRNGHSSWNCIFTDHTLFILHLLVYI